MRNNPIFLVFQFYMNDFPFIEKGFTFTDLICTCPNCIYGPNDCSSGDYGDNLLTSYFASFLFLSLSLNVRNFTSSLQMEIISWYF